MSINIQYCLARYLSDVNAYPFCKPGMLENYMVLLQQSSIHTGTFGAPKDLPWRAAVAAEGTETIN